MINKILIFTICAMFVGTVPVYAATSYNTTAAVQQLQNPNQNWSQELNHWYNEFVQNPVPIDSLVQNQNFQNQIVSILQNKTIRNQIHTIIQNKGVQSQINNIMKNKDVQNDINILMQNKQLKNEVNMVYNGT